MGAKLKVRQPLGAVEVVLADQQHQAWLEEHAALIADELNVKEVEFIEQADQYITYTMLPDLKRLGPRLGKRLPALRKLLAEVDGGRVAGGTGGRRKHDAAAARRAVALDSADIQVRLQAKEGWAAAQGHAVVVVLATELTEDLDSRRACPRVGPHHQGPPQGDGLPVHRSHRGGRGDGFGRVASAIEQFGDYIRGETLAVESVFGPLADVEGVDIDVAGHSAALFTMVK